MLFRSEDIQWAKKNLVDYAPLVYPGFSWGNMKGKEHNSFIPRNKGSFLWKQLMGAIRAGAEMIYVAMFDEIDEGTAIFKCAKKVPVGESLFVPLEEEVESDHYLKLVGEAVRSGRSGARRAEARCRSRPHCGCGRASLLESLLPGSDLLPDVYKESH